MRILLAILPTSRQRVCSERSHHFIPLLVYPNDTMPAVINSSTKLRDVSQLSCETTTFVNKLIKWFSVRRTVLSNVSRKCSQHMHSHHMQVNHGSISDYVLRNLKGPPTGIYGERFRFVVQGISTL